MPSRFDQSNADTGSRPYGNRRGRRQQNRPPPPNAPERRPQPELAWLIADWCQVWDLCGRPACRRARRCRVAAAPCFGEHIATVAALVGEDAAWDRLQAFAETVGDAIDG